MLRIHTDYRMYFRVKWTKGGINTLLSKLQETRNTTDDMTVARRNAHTERCGCGGGADTHPRRPSTHQMSRETRLPSSLYSGYHAPRSWSEVSQRAAMRKT